MVRWRQWLSLGLTVPLVLFAVGPVSGNDGQSKPATDGQPVAPPVSEPAEDPDPPFAAPLVMWPDRPTFTSQRPAEYVTLNSTVEGPVDDRPIVWIKPAGAVNSAYASKLNIKPGQRYTVAAFFHNSGAPSTTATNTRLRFVWPSVTKGSSALQAALSADNAKPGEVWGSATVSLPELKTNVALRVISKSAKLYSSNNATSIPLETRELFSDRGALIGCTALDGLLPGQCRGSVTLDVVADFASFDVRAWLSVPDKGEYSNEARVRPGEEVTVRVLYQNTGSMQQDNVVLAVSKLPPAVTVVPGTTYISNANTGSKWKLIEADMRRQGLNVGNYLPPGNVYLKFNVRVGGVDAIREFDPEFPTNGTVTLLPPIRVTANTDNGAKGNFDDQSDPWAPLIKVLGPAQHSEPGR